MGSTLLTVPPLALDFTGSATPAAFGVRNGHRMVRFGDTGNTEAFYSNFMPEGYIGSGLSVTLAWMAESATTGDVDWDVAFERLDAGGQDLDSDGFTTPKTATSTTTAAVSGQLVYTTITFTAGEADSLQPNEKFRIRIRRLGDNGTDTMVGEAQITDVSINQVAFSGTLTVEEQDGNPSVTGVRVIKFDNTTVTDDGGDTVSVTSAGGGGGFFSDGAGTDAAIGKGTPTAPVAPGVNCLASGDAAMAGNQGTDSFAWGDRAFANGQQSVAIGNNVGWNNYNAYGTQIEGPHYSFVQGENIRVCSFQNGLFAQGENLTMYSQAGGYGRAYFNADYVDTYHQFIAGKNTFVKHAGYEYYAGDYYAHGPPAFVWGDSHTVNTDSYYVDHRRRVAVCMGYNNTLDDGGGWVFGSGSTLTAGGGSISSPQDNFLFGTNSDVTALLDGTWAFLRDTTIIASEDWFLWGEGHINHASGGGARRVLLAGRGHSLRTPSSGSSDGTIFLWGYSGGNGHQLGNENFFGWSVAAGVLGPTQHSFVVDGLQTTNATANQVLTTLNTDHRAGYHFRIEVIAYDRINAAQVAIFHVDQVIGYRTTHTGAPVLIPAGPIALTSVNSGGASATWTARLAVNGTAGYQIQVTGSATETVMWTGRIVLLASGGTP